ncbi:unnamed protein product [Clonostachys byssicola]|uniref:GST N-terminal domain-containing protein n=1 Tax=Clonostachys byssicola TaxID=160290 RepID=A0A9N9UEE1_9HYPO|nr:unnamed protein product [Clonostachys byssicola]
MASGRFTLIDIPTKEPRKCWSLNPWKTRMLLHYKSIDYETEWVEYPHLQARLEPFVAPNASGHKFSSPALKLPNGTYLMDSYVIAEAIERSHTTPSLHLGNPLQQPLLDALHKLDVVLEPVYKTRVPKVYLSEISREYFERTRFERVGTSLERFEKENPLNLVFKKLAPIFRELNDIVKKNQGPFILGEEVSYADFILGGWLLFFKGMGDDVWDGLLESSGEQKLYEGVLQALSSWTKRDN